ncbi:MAG TPA: excinuclease ABC subunit UvrC [Anaerolineae bacterium]|nr:excinuclease ABC subunit UvrC [Anaerolineae bacterium]
MDRSQLKEQLNALPARPGVYLMKDERGKILYVGKAVNLRNRVRSYFHASASHTPKIQRLVKRIAEVDFIVTDSELEALILECNLIKRHRPRYNVRFKDDKRYPYIKVTWQEEFPKVFITRRMERDGARYFGPFTAAWAVHETLHTLRRIFPYLTCNRKITGTDRRACLYWDIGLCMAPCIGASSKEEYRAMMDQLCRFLEGRADEIVADLQSQMREAAEGLEFERAATLRDKIRAIERVIERQKIVSVALGDQDVIALARADGQACVQVFFVRHGKLIGREYFVLEGAEGEETRAVMTSFVKQFYDEAAYVPPEILLQSEVDEAQVIEAWLRERRGGRVTLRVPRRGRKRELVEMAAENAAETLAALRAQWRADTHRQEEALADLQTYLGLSEPPARIECYDVSNIQGTAATGSMVVFVNGVPRKGDYRRFKIRTVQGADDYAMLQEVLRRRFKRAKAAEELKGSRGTQAWTLLPDLVVVDGGKGQLSAAREVMRELGVDQIPTVGLAKEREEVFVPGRSEPIPLPRDSQGLYLLQRIRDEAHRFAVTYHRGLREKRGLASLLEEIPGIGPKRRQALLKHFGSLEAIRAATVEELAAVPGMTRKVAERVLTSVSARKKAEL